MKLRRDLSGRELADALCRHWNYREVHQSGSRTNELPSQRIDILNLGLSMPFYEWSPHKNFAKEEIHNSIA
jgi:hypothetical protein